MKIYLVMTLEYGNESDMDFKIFRHIFFSRAAAIAYGESLNSNFIVQEMLPGEMESFNEVGHRVI